MFYMGEILLAIGALLIAALLCLRRRLAERTQLLMAFMLLCGVALCFAAAMGKEAAGAGTFLRLLHRLMARSARSLRFCAGAMAFVGFESVSHSTAEARFPLKHSFRILAVSVVTAAAAYILLSLWLLRHGGGMCLLGGLCIKP
jgi:amino acid transporter